MDIKLFSLFFSQVANRGAKAISLLFTTMLIDFSATDAKLGRRHHTLHPSCTHHETNFYIALLANVSFWGRAVASQCCRLRLGMLAGPVLAPQRGRWTNGTGADCLHGDPPWGAASVRWWLCQVITQPSEREVHWSAKQLLAVQNFRNLEILRTLPLFRLTIFWTKLSSNSQRKREEVTSLYLFDSTAGTIHLIVPRPHSLCMHKSYKCSCSLGRNCPRCRRSCVSARESSA